MIAAVFAALIILIVEANPTPNERDLLRLFLLL